MINGEVPIWKVPTFFLSRHGAGGVLRDARMEFIAG
jgi:hypothetical protein